MRRVWERLVLLPEIDCLHRLVFLFAQVPDVEVLSSVNHEEFTQASHQTTAEVAAHVVTVVVHQTPVDLRNGVLASIVPDSDR